MSAPKRVIHWISTDGSTREEVTDKQPDRAAMGKFVDGDIELVWVLFKGRKTVMYVNDFGRTNGLPVNPTATPIYYAATAAQGVDMSDKEQREAFEREFWASRGIDPDKVINVDPFPDDAPAIHGPAIVLENFPNN